VKILIRDIVSAPAGAETKPFKLSLVAELTKIPAPLLKLAIRPGTIVELTIESTIATSTKYFVME
jgi:hypothetical protein